MPPVPRALLWALVLPVLSSMAACGDTTTADVRRPVVVATHSILADVVGHVVDETATVEVLVPRGVDPHGYEPSARQVARVTEADLVVANGLGLEQALEGALTAAERAGVPVLRVGELVDPLPLDVAGGHGHDHAATEEHEEEGEGAERGEGHALDPHVWMDPLRMAAALDDLATAVAGATDLDHEELARAARGYATTLEELDGAIRAELAAIPPERRLLVTNHATLGYFAARYDLEVVGVVVPGGSSLAEPGAGHLAELAATVARHDIPAVFAESTSSDRLAQALAAEVGREVAVVELATDALGDPDGESGTYVDLLRTTARRIGDALR